MATQPHLADTGAAAHQAASGHAGLPGRSAPGSPGPTPARRSGPEASERHGGAGTTTRPATRSPVAVRALVLGGLAYCYTWLDNLSALPPIQLVLRAALVLGISGWFVLKVARRERLPASPLALPLAALLMALAASTSLSIAPERSVNVLLTALTFTMLYLIICDLLLAGWSAQALLGGLVVLVSLMIAHAVIVALLAYRDWWLLRVPEYPTFPIAYRLGGAILHPNVFAALINTTLPLVILRAATAPGRRERLAWLLWLAGAVVVLSLTRSRGGLIGACLATGLVLGWLAFRDGWPASWRPWLARTWPLAGGVLGYAAVYGAVFLATTGPATSAYTTNAGGLTADRAIFWGVAWQIFTSHPLAGSGPGTYALLYQNYWPGSRAWAALHAHNLPLDLLANTGVLGAAAASVVLGAGMVTMVRGLRQAAPSTTILLVGGCAAFSAILAHMMVDVLFYQTTLSIALILLAAVMMHAAGALRRPAGTLPRWTAVALGAAVVLAVVFVRQHTSLAATSRGLAALEQRDWAAAARSFDAAVAASSSAHGQVLRGYAYAMLATTLAEPQAAAAQATALAAYDQAVWAEPMRVPYLVGAAALHDAAGERDQATALWEHAHARGGDWALPALALGVRAEAAGDGARADALFAQAFSAEPDASMMLICRQSARCREAASRLPPPPAHRQVHLDGQALLAAGQPHAALALFNQVPIASQSPVPWIDRAAAHLALGQLPQAHYALVHAARVNDNYVRTAILAARPRAAWMQATGRADEAILTLEALVDYRLHPGELLPPAAAHLVRTPDELAAMQDLAGLYERQARPADAARVRADAQTLASRLGLPLP